MLNSEKFIKSRTITLLESKLKALCGYELSEVKHSICDDNHDLVYVYKNMRNNETIVFDCLSQTIQIICIFGCAVIEVDKNGLVDIICIF